MTSRKEISRNVLSTCLGNDALFHVQWRFEMIKSSHSLIAAAAVLTMASLAPAHAAVDADAAQALMKSDGCTKCHAADKDKKGPSLKKIAVKFKADGADKLAKKMTESHKVKLDDGSEEDHKVLTSKDPKAVKNLADFILAQ